MRRHLCSEDTSTGGRGVERRRVGGIDHQSIYVPIEEAVIGRIPTAAAIRALENTAVPYASVNRHATLGIDRQSRRALVGKPSAGEGPTVPSVGCFVNSIRECSGKNPWAGIDRCRISGINGQSPH